jgi:class 3 adenylate cyclase
LTSKTGGNVPTDEVHRPEGTASARERAGRSVSPVEIRDLDRPQAVVTYPLGETQQVRLAGTVVSRIVLQPGWNWQEHAQPIVGTAACELYHRGFVLRGRLGVRADAGEEWVIPPNHVFDISPGHVTWVEGDDELVMVDWAGGGGFGVTPGAGLRSIATILFTDIVDSTRRAQREGDTTWRHTIEMHDDVVRSVLVGFGGREMNTAGDSFLVLFNSAERAIRCGLALFEALAGTGISIRVGVHSGEVIVADEKVHGFAVHVAARIVAGADSGEVLISRITRDLAEGSSGLTFEARGLHRLKGVEGEQELFAASSADQSS